MPDLPLRPKRSGAGGRVIDRAIGLVALLALLVAACAGRETVPAGPTATSIPGTGPAVSGEPIVIRTRMVVASESGAEPIATGEVVSSTLAGSPFCAGGTVVDSHGSTDPAVWLIAETITCQDGSLTLLLTPDEPQGLNQTGSWTVDRGTGAYEGMRGSGEMEIEYDADPDSPALVRLTGTVTR